MSRLNLNDHHQSLALNYLRFARFQRGQCLRSIKNCFDDARDTKFPDPTYTVDEIRDALEDLSQEVSVEMEAELINSAHTNVLLLQQVFAQAQHWHLDLEADLAELENRELLDKVKNWEDSELSDQKVGERPSLELPKQKRLTPLMSAEGGPAQIIKAQLEESRKENDALRKRLAELERTATAAMSGKAEAERRAKEDLAVAEKKAERSKAEEEDVKELEDAVKSIRFQMATEKEVSAKTQKELEGSLKDAKHALLEVQHNLKLAEKELEKRFSETGAYKNMKKMLSSKNVQIRELRDKLKQLEGGDQEEEEEE